MRNCSPQRLLCPRRSKRIAGEDNTIDQAAPTSFVDDTDHSRSHRVQERCNQVLQVLVGDRHRQVNSWQQLRDRDHSSETAAQCDFGTFHCGAQTARCARVAQHLLHSASAFVLQSSQTHIHQPHIDGITTSVCPPKTLRHNLGRSQMLVVPKLHCGDVETTGAPVHRQRSALPAGSCCVGRKRSDGGVHQPQHTEPRQSCRHRQGVAMGITPIAGHCQHSVHRRLHMEFSPLPQLTKHEATHLFNEDLPTAACLQRKHRTTGGFTALHHRGSPLLLFDSRRRIEGEPK
mmetsp:Transcript_38729/g.101198  ORF Transcript_38729/g.101198 Transcript_38729/m.101198 type:complete len:289 (+) Transcript_38729:1417-2283(+)